MIGRVTLVGVVIAVFTGQALAEATRSTGRVLTKSEYAQMERARKDQEAFGNLRNRYQSGDYRPEIKTNAEYRRDFLERNGLIGRGQPLRPIEGGNLTPGASTEAATRARLISGGTGAGDTTAGGQKKPRRPSSGVELIVGGSSESGIARRQDLPLVK